MKRRTVGKVEYASIRLLGTKTLMVSGQNSKGTIIDLEITLSQNKTQRLNTLTCAIRQLKRQFTAIKEEIEADVDRAYESARLW